MNDCNPIPCTCVDGPIGPQGLAGPKGDDGAPGVDGNQGIAGPQGEQGSQGEQGIIGDQGLAGDDVIGGVGSTGAQGPIGPQGPQGPNGLDGSPGSNGTDGADVDAPSNIIYTGFVGTIDIPNMCTDCVGDGAGMAGTGPNGINKWNDKTGPGYSRVDVGNSPDIGDKSRIIGFNGAAAFKLRCILAQMNSFEIAAYNSTTANKALGSATAGGGNPWPEAGLKFESPNGSDSIEYVYAGDGEWVIVKALLAGGVLPTVI